MSDAIHDVREEERPEKLLAQLHQRTRSIEGHWTARSRKSCALATARGILGFAERYSQQECWDDVTQAERLLIGSPVLKELKERIRGIDAEYEECDTVWYLAGRFVRAIHLCNGVIDLSLVCSMPIHTIFQRSASRKRPFVKPLQPFRRRLCICRMFRFPGALLWCHWDPLF